MTIRLSGWHHLMVLLAVTSACNRSAPNPDAGGGTVLKPTRPLVATRRVPSEAIYDTVSDWAPTDSGLVALAHDSSIIRRFQAAPRLPTRDTIFISTAINSKGIPYRGDSLPGELELRLEGAYPGVADSGPNVFVVNRVDLPSGWEGFILRVPGMYDPSRLDLWLLSPKRERFALPIELADSWGDAGEEFWFDTWVIRGPTGQVELVHHQCQTYFEPGSDDTVPTTLEGERLA